MLTQADPTSAWFSFTGDVLFVLPLVSAHSALGLIARRVHSTHHLLFLGDRLSECLKHKQLVVQSLGKYYEPDIEGKMKVFVAMDHFAGFQDPGIG